MTPLERIASLYALLQGSGIDIIAETSYAGLRVKLYSACGKEANFNLTQNAIAKEVAEKFGDALQRLAELRQAEITTQKETS